MQLYRWRARSKTGKLYQGSYLADTEQEVAAFLRANYGYVTGIEEAKSLTEKIKRWLPSSSKVNDRERSRFFQQLATMLGSGITLCRALELLKTRCPAALTPVCSQLIADLQAGKALAASMQKQPQVFAAVTVAIVEAGEQGGVLQEMLAELAVYYEQKAATVRFLKNICLYPCFVLLLSLATFCVFLIKLLPLFADLYQSFDMKLSVPLQGLLLLRELAGEYWQGAAVAAAVGAYYLWQRRRVLVKCFWSWPGIVSYRQMFLEIRFCKILALLLYSGIPLPLAIKTAADGTDDALLIARAQAFADAIVRGSDITKAAALASPLLSSVTIEFLVVGESSGALATMLQQAAQILEQDFTAQLKNLKVLLEPVLLVIIALVVGLMIFTVASPLLTLLTEMPEYE